MASIRPIWLIIGLFIFVCPSSKAQGYTAWSVNAGLAIFLSDDDPFQVDGLTLIKSKNNLEYGVNIQGRLFLNELSPISIEYGLGLNQSSHTITVNSPTDRPRDISIDRTGISLPTRVFYGGKFTRNRNQRQSGLFIEAIPSGRFGSDISRSIFDFFLGLGARTRGRHVFYQLAFDWQVFSTKTRFHIDDKSVSFRDRSRRAALLTIGYQFP